MALWNATSSFAAQFSKSIISRNLARAASTAPSVYDKIVDITVIDQQGKRHSIRGLEGQSLVDVIQSNTHILGEDAVARGPEGAGTIESHIKIPNELLDRFPRPEGDESRYLSEVGVGVDERSRLASKIILDKSLKGALVALSENAPWKTL